jgi:hypothetical protein
MEQQSAEVWAYLNSMCCMELLRTVDVVLKDPDYEKNEIKASIGKRKLL